jgi:hypothetical protein
VPTDVGVKANGSPYGVRATVCHGAGLCGINAGKRNAFKTCKSSVGSAEPA